MTVHTYAHHLASRMLAGDGLLSVTAYRVDPLNTMTCLWHGMDRTGSVIVHFDTEDVSDILHDDVEVRVDVVKSSLEVSEDITVASLHSLGRLEWLSVDEYTAVACIRLDSAHVHWPGGVEQLLPADIDPTVTLVDEIAVADELYRIGLANLVAVSEHIAHQPGVHSNNAGPALVWLADACELGALLVLADGPDVTTLFTPTAAIQDVARTLANA
ncbi:hypothetical protein [Corynebacterium uterequi]|uniref:Uncharacterized protein n=1 Tax=Corynebacterium uterequi TaxID=1072256 RepID=A0A0G3HG08_9CORY|nr:hypothetical protein [Corynebacterium uterequi]AKK10092.1 hypothetical protein CUTER_00315 [Corynebacterium uterequi]